MTPPLAPVGRPAALAVAAVFALGWACLFFLVLGSFELLPALLALGVAGFGLTLLQIRIVQPPDDGVSPP